jgi:predicted secreted Zn-dependent protease
MTESSEPPTPLALFVAKPRGGGAPLIACHVVCSSCQTQQTCTVEQAKTWAIGQYLCGPCFLKRVDENGPRIIKPFLSDKEW